MKIFAIAAALSLVTSCSGATNQCASEPLGRVNAFFAGNHANREVTAPVLSVTALPELAGFRYDLGDGSRLTWFSQETIPGVNEGRTYRFVVDYVGGFPDASSIVVFDGDELVFAALTDSVLFQHVLKAGVPGFTIAMGAETCRSRGRTRCYDAIVNVPVLITHAGERKSLYQGERDRIGEFEVRVLTAQSVKYSSRCADAGMPGVSITIQRVRNQARGRDAKRVPAPAVIAGRTLERMRNRYLHLGL